MAPVLLAHGSASGLAHSVSVPRSAMACSDRGSAEEVDSSTSASAAPSLSAGVMREGSIVLCQSGAVSLFGPHPEEHRTAMRLEGWQRVRAVHPSFETGPNGAPQDEVLQLFLAPSISIVLKGTDIGKDGDDLAFREGAAERRHGARLAIAYAGDDELVAALRSRQFRPLALGPPTILMAKPADARKQGGAVDVAGRRLRWRPSLGFGSRAWTLLRRDAGHRQREHKRCEHCAITQDRYSYYKHHGENRNLHSFPRRSLD